MQHDPNAPWEPITRSRLALRLELIWEGKYDACGERRGPSLPPFPVTLRRREVVDPPHASRSPVSGVFQTASSGVTTSWRWPLSSQSFAGA